MKKSLYLIVLFVLPFIASAQISFLKSVNNSASVTGSNPSNMTSFNGGVYFSASDGVTGTELWKTDGTSVGTVQVKDINPGDNSSSPANFILVGSYLYFSANDGDNGVELWRTDGTSAGTILVTDINPGLSSSSPTQFVVVNSTTLYFAATDVTNGREIWKTDVTTKTTSLIADINSGTSSSSPNFLTNVGGTIFFAATITASGNELWKTDGTPGNTVQVKDINPTGSSSSSPGSLVALNGSLLFFANDGTNGQELWISNGTGAGTTMLKNINPTASTGSTPVSLTVVGTIAVFAANDGTNGQELWRTDGTLANTFLAANVNSTLGLSGLFTVSTFTALGTTAVYFYANAGTGLGTELYRYTTAGSLSLIDINVGASSSSPSVITAVNGLIYASAATDAGGYELFRVTGTTFTGYDLLPGTGASSPKNFAALDATQVIYAANNGSGIELWKWNGTTNSQIVDLISGSDGSSPTDFAYNSTLNLTFFAADDGTGRELWKTDGTAAGTTQVSNIYTSGSADVANVTAIGGFVYYQAYNGTDYELYKSDATTTTKIDINPGASSSFPYQMTQLNATEFVLQVYTDLTGTELCKVNINTNAFTVYDIYPGTNESYPSDFAVLSGVAYFSAENATSGRELFKFTGSAFSVVAEIGAGTTSSDAYGVVAAAGAIYYIANTATTGYELYRSPGSGASLVKDIASGVNSSSPEGMIAIGSTVYFSANDGVNGYELWKTDGTSGGTSMVKDIYAGATSSSPFTFTVLNGKLYFTARDATLGSEMFVSDGTSAGTTLFKDLNAGPANGGYGYTVILGTKMFFVAAESTGTKVYVTDGRTCSTMAVTPFAGGATASALYLTQAPGNKMVFSMTLQDTGRELFALDPSLVTLPTDVAITVQPQPSTVTMPAAASFSVTATGTSITYQWQKNSVNILGATATTLNIATTSDTDAGNYKVIVTGTCGQVTSTEVSLTVNAITPIAQPTSLVFSNATTTSLGLSFTAASGSPSGYLVLRKKGSSPAEAPVDGTVYTAGSALGTSTIIAVGSAISGNDTGLDPASEYFYSVFSLNGGGTLVKYLTTTPLSGSGFTLALEPTGQPTALVFSNVDGSTLSGSFTAAASATRYLVIRTTGTAPTGVPADGKVYAVGEVLGDAVVAYLGDIPSFSDSGLTPEAHYFYQVFSARGPGPTINYLTTSPLSNDVTTLAAQPEAPTSLRFSNITTSSFTVSFTPPAQAPAGYVVLRNAGTTLTATPADATTYTLGQTVGDGRVAYVGANTTFDENIPLVQFTYAVFPYNGTGASINYRQATPLMNFIAPDDTPPIISDETQTSPPSGSSIKIVASITEPQSSIQEVTVTYRSVAAATSTTNTVPMELKSGKYEYTIPATEIGDLGIEYTITAKNVLSLTATKSGSRAVTFSSQTLTFTSFGTEVSAYRIVAVPLDLTSKSVSEVFGDDLGTYDGINWRMYRYDNNATTELTGSSQIEVGKGYWLIVKDNGKTIDTGPGTTPAVTSTAPFQYDLKEGWNQIGNPYNFNIVWNDVLTASNLNLKLRLYAGSFSDGDKLAKYQGGFVLSNSAAKLTFPVKYNSAAGRTSDEPKLVTNPIDQDKWEVILNLKHGNTTNPFGGVGMNKKANVLYDEFDDFTLPRFLDFVELNHDKKFLNIPYTKDVIPTVTNYTWEFNVESNSDGPTEFTWDNSYFGNNDKQLVLWDDEESLSIDMRKADSYSFNQRGAKRFKIFYGNKNYISEKTSMNSVLIHNISPNPTESELSVAFTIPGSETSFVEVKVLNSLGQPVSSVYNGELQGGYHQMIWSGKDSNGVRPAQGVYLVEVVANGQRLAKRVVLK